MRMKNKVLSLAFCTAIIFSNTLTAMEAGEGIDKEFRVRSGGSELYIKVRGQDIHNPVLLYLHGGPGK